MAATTSSGSGDGQGGSFHEYYVCVDDVTSVELFGVLISNGVQLDEGVEMVEPLSLLTQWGAICIRRIFWESKRCPYGRMAGLQVQAELLVQEEGFDTK